MIQIILDIRKDIIYLEEIFNLLENKILYAIKSDKLGEMNSSGTYKVRKIDSKKVSNPAKNKK